MSDEDLTEAFVKKYLSDHRIIAISLQFYCLEYILRNQEALERIKKVDYFTIDKFIVTELNNSKLELRSLSHTRWLFGTVRDHATFLNYLLKQEMK